MENDLHVEGEEEVVAKVGDYVSGMLVWTVEIKWS